MVITEPAQLQATVNSTNVNCNGGTNGSITISGPLGGSGNYEYTINGGTTWQASGTFNALTAGTYNVQIRDANNITCIEILNAALTITEPAILAAVVNSTNITCFGNTDGTITISGPTGGSGAYEYSINGGTSWENSGTYLNLGCNIYCND